MEIKTNSDLRTWIAKMLNEFHDTPKSEKDAEAYRSICLSAASCEKDSDLAVIMAEVVSE